MSQSAAVAERTLVGNRWVLVGGVGYLLEWVAIIWVGALGIGETVVRGDVIGAVSGVAIIGAQLTVAPAMQTLFDILFAFPILFWVWMLGPASSAGDVRHVSGSGRSSGRLLPMGNLAG
jgi:hypothetical protein